MPAHKHAESMRLYALDALETETPWELWEYRIEGGAWTSNPQHPAWSPPFEYRRKPRTITINGRELVAPERAAPKEGTDYWVPDLCEHGAVGDSFWDNSDIDQLWLKRGLVFLREEDAADMSEALLSVITDALKGASDMPPFHSGPPPIECGWMLTRTRPYTVFESWRWWNGSRWSLAAHPWMVPHNVSVFANCALSANDEIEWSLYYPANARVPETEARIFKEANRG